MVYLIAKKQNISEEDAIKKLYTSKLYATLEQEGATGDIQFPDV